MPDSASFSPSLFIPEQSHLEGLSRVWVGAPGTHRDQILKLTHHGSQSLAWVLLGAVVGGEAQPLTFCLIKHTRTPLDEREAVQKKTFTKWINSHLTQVSCRIGDLYTDLRDGYMLTKLLEVLSGEQLVSKEAPRWVVGKMRGGQCPGFQN